MRISSYLDVPLEVRISGLPAQDTPFISIGYNPCTNNLLTSWDIQIWLYNRGWLYIPIIRIPIKGGMAIPNIGSLGLGTYEFIIQTKRIS